MSRPNAYGRWFFALLSLSLLPAPLTAQEGRLEFEHLSVEDGLSHSTVRKIVQDHLGFLWFATQDGLNRYDGYQFKVYKHDPAEAGSLAESEIYTLLVDRQGELWVGTFGGGLDRFRRAEERFDHHRHDPENAASLSHDAVLSLLEDRDGTLWVGTEDGLNRLRRGDGSFDRCPLGATGPRDRRRRAIFSLHEDRSGGLWVGASTGLYRREGTALVAYPSASPDPRSSGWNVVYAIAEDAQGRLWIGTGDGLKRLDPRTGAVEHYGHDPSDPRSLSEDVVLSLLLDRQGELWVGTETQGLDRVAPDRVAPDRVAPDRVAADRTPIVFTHARHDPLDPRSLSDNSVLCLYEGPSGILWLGGYVGVNKYDRSRERFATYRQRPARGQTLTSASLWALHEDGAGELWVGTYDSGLNRFDRERRTVVHYPPAPEDPGGLPHGTVSALFEDRSGTLWVGTWGGLSRLEPDRPPRLSEGRPQERFVTYRHDPADPQSLSSDYVYSIHRDRAGRLWVGTYVGLNRLECSAGGGARFIRYPTAAGEPELLAETPIYAIHEDRAGTLWFGSDRDGLFRLAAEAEAGGFRHYRHDPARRDSLSSDKIAVIYESGAGVLWIGTYGGGLNRLDLLDDGGPRGGEPHARFRHYRARDGLPSDTVLGILEDDRGRLWLSTTRGLSRFDPRSLSFRSYDVHDGLQGNVFSSRSAFRSARGEMLFGGTRGLNAFFPDRIVDDPQPPPVVITDFRLFNRSVRLRSVDPDSPLERSILATRELVLTHRDYVFALEFAALHYGSPRKNRYAYRLHGFDRDWVYTDATQRLAHYSNLPPGDYVFQVRGSNRDGVWNDEGARLRIDVLPAPWETWWAYTLYGLALAAAVVTFVRSHQNKVRREQAINRQLREADRLKGELIAELETKNAELERFAYTVSHDLKSPLVTIKGFLGFLEQDASRGDAEALRRDIRRISAAADTMGRLLGELLELSRIGRVLNPPEEAAIADLAREARDLVAGAIAERGVEVTIAPDLPTVTGDRARLVEVYQNLLENAVKHMGGRQQPRVEIGSRTDGEELVFFVRDNGAGIDPRYHEKVFGLFERLNAETEGTGVGLALVKRIVEVHGGRIWVESEGRGQGSTFCFTLPGGGAKAGRVRSAATRRE